MFLSERTLDLSKYGWKDCSIVFNALSFEELTGLQVAKAGWSTEDPKSAEDIFARIEAQFVRGEALNEKSEKVELKKEDLKQIPFDMFVKIIEWLLSGELDPFLDPA